MSGMGGRLRRIRAQYTISARFIVSLLFFVHSILLILNQYPSWVCNFRQSKAHRNEFDELHTSNLRERKKYVVCSRQKAVSLNEISPLFRLPYFFCVHFILFF